MINPRIPALGSQQTDVRWDGGQPRIRTRSRWCWRAFDGVLSALNPGMRVTYIGRSTPATIYDSEGVSGALPAAEPAFSSIDWDGDGQREEDALVLSPDEALRYDDPYTGRLHWDTGPMTLRFDWVQRGTGPIWSFCADSGLGAWLRLAIDDEGLVTWAHHNGTSTVTSGRAASEGDRCAAVVHLHADGRVQLELVRNGGAREVGDRSEPLAPAEVWGNGGATKVRVGEWIDAEGSPVRGLFALRYGAAWGGILSRRETQALL